MAIIGFIVPMYLLDKGVSLPLITLISGIAAIPWVIKFVWGGIVDYFIHFGRKKFIIIGSILAIISLFILSFIDPGIALIPFTVFLFLSHCGVAFLDVSADAWAIEISKKEERGKINGAMMAGNLIGISLGVSFFALISNTFNYSFTFITAGLFVLLLIIYPLIVKEIKKGIKHDNSLSLLIEELKKKTTILIAIFGLTLFISHGLHTYIIPIFQKTILHLDIVQIGYLALAMPIPTLLGSIIGGVLSDRWGRKKTLYFFIFISIMFSASLIFVNTWQLLLILYGPVLFSYAGLITSYAAMAMDVTNPKVGATQFSLFMSIANAGEWIAASMSGALVVMLGYSRVFLYSAWVFGPALLLLYFIRHIKRDKLR